jgi:hypothetical protein
VEGNQLADKNLMEIYNMEIHNMEIHNMEIHNMEIHNYNVENGSSAVEFVISSSLHFHHSS